MALNFPNTPAPNEEYKATNGVTYVWDGAKWTARGTETGLPLLPDEDGNVVITGTLTVNGTTITGNSLTVTDITGVSADISGSVTAGSGDISGDLTAANADLSGNLNVAGDIDND